MPLDLSFDTEQIRELCRNEVEAYRKLPNNVARALLSRVADIRAVENILKIPIGSPTEVVSRPPGEVRVSLPDGYYISLVAANQKIPISPDGSVKWENVSRVKLLRVGVEDE